MAATTASPRSSAATLVQLSVALGSADAVLADASFADAAAAEGCSSGAVRAAAFLRVAGLAADFVGAVRSSMSCSLCLLVVVRGGGPVRRRQSILAPEKAT